MFTAIREYHYMVQVVNEEGFYEDYRMFELELTARRCADCQAHMFGKSAIIWNLDDGTIVEEYIA